MTDRTNLCEAFLPPYSNIKQYVLFCLQKKLQFEMFQAKFPGVKVLCLKNVFDV